MATYESYQVVPIKERWININPTNGLISEAIENHDKLLFKQFGKYIDNELHNAAWYNVQKLIFNKKKVYFGNTRSFISNASLNSFQCCLTFSWIELQTLPRCFLIHVSIVIVWHFLYLVDLCSCLRFGLFMLLFTICCSFSFLFSL